MRIKLSCPLELKEIVGAVSALPFNNLDKTVSYISTDTRELKKGDLFFALKGNNFNGEDYVEEALSLGAIPVSTVRNNNSIIVNDTKEALLDLAEYYKSKLPTLRFTVAITGSVGKTTTKEFLKYILSTKYRVHATHENQNNDIGVPITVLSAPKNCEVLITELGMNSLGEIERLSRCVKPDYAIITNIGTSHIGRLGSRRLIAKAKSEIVIGMSNGSVFCEWEEPLLKEIPLRETVSVNNHLADYFLFEFREYLTHSSFDFYSKEAHLNNLTLNIGGKHQLKCLAYAIAVGLKLGLSEVEIKRGVEAIPKNAARHRLIELNDFYIFDDSYNASIESVKADLEYLSINKTQPKSMLLGDILELGTKTEEIHTEIGRMAVSFKLNRLYLFGIYTEYVKRGAIEAGMDERKIFINLDLLSPEITAEQIRINHEKNEIILFKASHNVRLSRVIDLLKGDKDID